jgi:hypothetical protein
MMLLPLLLSGHNIVTLLQSYLVVLCFAGLVRVLCAACPELAAAIKQQQQQQQQDPAAAESLLCTRLLAAAVLGVMRRCILADRPAQVRTCLLLLLLRFWREFAGLK